MSRKQVTPTKKSVYWWRKIMPGRSSKDHDFTTVARRVVEEAIGEKLNGEPLETPTKNPAAVALGRLGGQKGGNARAKALTPEQRVEIAKRAAEKRWNRPRGSAVQAD
jgi:hypothetical protein